MAGLVSCGLMAVGPASAFASGWRSEPSQNPGGYNDAFTGVSCASPAACIAVGPASANDSFALSERWNSGHWVAVATAHPAGSDGSALAGVSCTSATSCTGVGSYYVAGSSAPRPVAEHWNGHHWSIEHAARPAGGGGELLGVSCASRTECIAVGAHGHRPLVESWNGHRWSLVRGAFPSGVRGKLRGVSCATAHACTAVGSGQGGRPLLAGWDGRRWNREFVRGLGALTSVSCAAARSCTAVGSRGNVPLAEYWDGGSWSTEHAAVGSGTTETLDGVSCSALHTCTAVGVQQTPYQADRVLAERLTGGHWSVQSAPNGSSLGGGLSAVSCPSAHSCTAVGAYFGQITPNSYPVTVSYTLAERWTG